MSRHPVEYCRHCDDTLQCTWFGTNLHCGRRDHFVRSRRPTPPSPAATAKGNLASSYTRARRHVGDAFHGRGQYSWDDLIDYCTRKGFTDLVDLCREMKTFE